MKEDSRPRWITTIGAARFSEGGEGVEGAFSITPGTFHPSFT